MQFTVLNSISLEERLSSLLPRFIELEQASYPSSEAASEKSLDLRVRRCAEWFVFMRDPAGVVMGFACGTLGLTDNIVSADAMTSHHENGNRLFLHSVVVENSLRGKGYGLALVKEFVAAARNTPQVEAISLISKAKGIALYSRAGFSFVGDSPLRHGSERWYAMELRLRTNRVVCVDAFSAEPFKGNSAAVLLLPDRPFEKVKLSEQGAAKKLKVDGDENFTYMGKTAREFNVAETAFVQFTELNDTGFGSTLDPLNKILAVAMCGQLAETSFNETLATVKAHFQFRSDVRFRVGDVISEKGQNVGSLCMLGFAKACELDNKATARMWCEHHTNVLDHPDDTTAHPNIRSFLTGGKVEFQLAADGSEIVTPIESFDIYALALLASRNSSILSEVTSVSKVAAKLIEEHVYFDKTISEERQMERFRALFQVDEDHFTTSRKFQDISSLSKHLLAIIARYNIVDVPDDIIASSLGGQSLDAFCQEHKLDDYTRKRLGVFSPSPLSLSVAASLRWFTPAQVEVDLCGHATLAAAHALFFEFGPIARRADFNLIRFQTRSGELIATKGKDGRSIELDFPSHTVTPLELSEPLVELLKESFPLLTIEADLEMLGKTSTNDHMVVISRDAFINRLASVELGAIKRFGCRGLSVTCLGEDNGVDFLSRFFAPQVGIDEDPVTGSAHCFLAPFWGAKLGRSIVTGVQLSAREGRVECEVKGDRIVLRGFCALSWRGEVVQM